MNLADYIWHALYCPPNQELRTASDLVGLRCGLEVVVPVERRWRPKRAGSKLKREVSIPALPRYVFTGFPAAPNWQELRERVVTIQGFMAFGAGGPAKLPWEAVEWLFRLKRQYDGVEEPKPFSEAVKPGDRARVVGGAFAGHVVTVDKIVAKEIHTMQNLLGGMVLVKIGLANLELVG